LRIKPDVKFLTPPVTKYIANNGLYIEQQIKPLMSVDRFQHTLRVTKLAMDFAKFIDNRLTKKAYIAAMYHDVCKELSDKDIRKYTNQKTNKSIHVLHGIAGSNYVRKYFNIKDKEILQAIANHVIPQKNPSLLSKIIYCADKLESGRTKHDINNRIKMINLVKRDINKYFKQLYFLTQSKYS
jgi:nicotinate-nucleotide adenylyltransferase